MEFEVLTGSFNCQNCAVEHFDITNNCTLERILFQVLVGAPFSVHAFSLSKQRNIAVA